MTVLQAEGFADLGMWEDAWEALEGLPSTEQAEPPALRVRIRCCPALQAWETGRETAERLRQGDEVDRAVAAGFFLADAKRLLVANDKDQAAVSLKAAIESWPDCREALLNDPQFMREFF